MCKNRYKKGCARRLQDFMAKGGNYFWQGIGAMILAGLLIHRFLYNVVSRFLFVPKNQFPQEASEE